MADQMTLCTNCQRQIASTNFVTHSVHCHRNLIKCEKCGEAVPRSSLEEHHAEFHTPVTCPDCKMKVERNQLDKHKESLCRSRQQSCRYCELEMPATDLSEHENYCGSRTKRCDECGEYVMLKYEQLHLDSNHGFLKLDDEPGPTATWIKNDIDSSRGSRAKNNNAKKPLLNKVKFNSDSDEEVDEIDRMLASLVKKNQPKKPAPPRHPGVAYPVMNSGVQRSVSRSSPPVFSISDSDDDLVALPCEFCNALVPSTQLLLHQTGCRADVTSLPSFVHNKPKKEVNILQDQTKLMDSDSYIDIEGDSDSDNEVSNGGQINSQGHKFFNENDKLVLKSNVHEDVDHETKLPCEFCAEGYPPSQLLDHQKHCDQRVRPWQDAVSVPAPMLARKKTNIKPRVSPPRNYENRVENIDLTNRVCDSLITLDDDFSIQRSAVKHEVESKKLTLHQPNLAQVLTPNSTNPLKVPPGPGQLYQSQQSSNWSRMHSSTLSSSKPVRPCTATPTVSGNSHPVNSPDTILGNVSFHQRSHQQSPNTMFAPVPLISSKVQKHLHDKPIGDNQGAKQYPFISTKHVCHLGRDQVPHRNYRPPKEIHCPLNHDPVTFVSKSAPSTGACGQSLRTQTFQVSNATSHLAPSGARPRESGTPTRHAHCPLRLFPTEHTTPAPLSQSPLRTLIKQQGAIFHRAPNPSRLSSGRQLASFCHAPSSLCLSTKQHGMPSPQAPSSSRLSSKQHRRLLPHPTSPSRFSKCYETQSPPTSNLLRLSTKPHRSPPPCASNPLGSLRRHHEIASANGSSKSLSKWHGVSSPHQKPITKHTAEGASGSGVRNPVVSSYRNNTGVSSEWNDLDTARPTAATGAIPKQKAGKLNIARQVSQETPGSRPANNTVMVNRSHVPSNLSGLHSSPRPRRPTDHTSLHNNLHDCDSN